MTDKRVVTDEEAARLRQVHFACDNAEPKCPHSALLDTRERCIEVLEDAAKDMETCIEDENHSIEPVRTLLRELHGEGDGA